MSGEAANRSCGDACRVWLRRTDGRIAAISHETEGCAICQACADLIAGLATGIAGDLTGSRLATLWAGALACLGGEAPPVTQDDEAAGLFEIFAGLAPYRSRHRCALLPYQALEAAMRAADGKLS